MKQPLIALCLILLQPACASIVSPSNERLQVYASSKRATVSVDGVERGTAPISLDIPKGRNTLVEVTAPGHDTKICSTRMSASVGYVVADTLLCVLLFPIGCISFIDAGGAWNALETPVCSIRFSAEANGTLTTER
jgi:hypothetical protein